MDTEAMAVAAVKTAIAKTNYLTDYIKDKDKEPMWDGAIYAYSSKSKSNSDWIGRAAVQVKGESVDCLERKELKYDIEVDDLKNYKRDGGLLFFVVAIDKGFETKIFYKALTPFLINGLLDAKPKQKTIRIAFDAFPKKPDEICNVVMDFIRDSRKQDLFTHDKIPTLEEFIKSAGRNLSYGFQYSGIGYDRNTSYKYLLDHELYMYARNTKLNIDFPIEHIQRVEKVEQSVEGKIKIGQKEYYEHYDVVHKKNGLELHIGRSVVLDFDTLKEKARIEYKLKGNIKEQIKDIQFIIDLIKERKVSIKGVDFPIEPTKDELKLFHIEDAIELQKRLITIDDMLTSMGVKEPLEMENLSQKEEDYLNMLITSFVNKQSVTFTEKRIPAVGGIAIGNLSLLLYFREIENGKYLVENFSDVELDVAGEYTDGTKFKTSKYIIMKADDIIKASNCTCQQIVDELISIDNDGHYVQSNFVLLELIKAYDQTNESQYLDESIRLADWLRKAEPLKGMSIINYYQCIKRRMSLSEDQEDEILKIIEEYNDKEEMKTGAYILLENYKMAKKCLNKLASKEQELFKTYPIYRLMEA